MLTLRTAAIAAAIAALAACSSDKGDKGDDTKDEKADDAALETAMKTADAAPATKPATGQDAAGAATTPGDAGAAATEGTVDAAPAAEKPPEKKLENIKVLSKKWDYDKVKKYMKTTIGRGLGQKCKFCHDTKDYASDDNKHKKIARDMITMTNALNRKYFKGQGKITCYTCHLGKKEPK